MISKRAGVRLLIVITAVVAAIGLLLPRIPQPQSYHTFADQRSFLGIPQFWRRGFQSSFLRGWTLGSGVIASIRFGTQSSAVY